MSDAILTLNAGSSSIKFALFRRAGERKRIAGGAVQGIGEAPRFAVADASGAVIHTQDWPHGQTMSHEELLAPVLEWVEGHLGAARLVAAGHRIVHGGDRFAGPARLDAAALDRLATLNQLAPLHEPHNLAAVAAMMRLRPGLPEIGCFDTSFHRTMDKIAARLPLPRHFHDEGVRRYGFHGLSYEYIAGELARLAPGLAAGRVVVAHLGNGASACGMRGGKSVDSSMGFTALDGLVMGSRCGTMDAGVLLYLMQARGMDADGLTTLLYKQSGLLGVSGISADMRRLLASPAAAAAEAIEVFTLAAAKHVAALAVSLGGVDGLVFTAGIGEHSPDVRAAICGRLGWLGVEIDEAANAKNDGVISTAASEVEVRVIPTDEEAMIARDCASLI